MSFSNFTQILADASADVGEKSSNGGYVPSRGICYFFVVLFTISTLAHLGQGLYTRMWWTIPTIFLAGTLEILGWSGRLWLSFSPSLDTPYMIQIVCTIIGPTPLVAANFIILGTIIGILGPMYSRLGPRNYSRVFLSCDIVSLVVQGAGGGIAATKIMLGGIIFQLNEDHGRRLCFNILCLFIRCATFSWSYHAAGPDLTDGWHGRIINTEIYFTVLDGAMVVLAIYTLNFTHPGYLLDGDTDKESFARRSGALGHRWEQASIDVSFI
ncbi:hypothetical protein BDZ89DRAFT_1057637 [Hymenopellis radicata]|nr:hypothetical protein BDZ89DRAFT_1057637 [Hymenopellis radicata]